MGIFGARCIGRKFRRCVNGNMPVCGRGDADSGVKEEMKGIYFVADKREPPDVIVYYCHGMNSIYLP